MCTASYFGLFIIVLKFISYVDTYRIEGNLCWSMPCLNGGSCFGSPYTYMCVCPINYGGALCEKRHGICQKNPCGNRGLCIEKNLSSFECRCYYDYIGPRCEEHIKNTKRSIWSSMLPMHTQTLFNMLRDAYSVKAKQRILPAPKNGQIDFLALLAAFTSRMTTTRITRVKPVVTTNRIETTQKNLIISGHDIQLENLFPKENLTANKQFSHYENFTINNNTFDNITNTSTQQSEFDYSDTIDDEELDDIETSTFVLSFNEDNNTITTNNSMNKIINSTELELSTITQSIDVNTSMNHSQMNSSTLTSLSPTAVSNNYYQLLHKLCEKISHILPNASASINSSLILSNTANETLNVLFSWLDKYINSTKNIMTIPTTTTLSSLVIEEVAPSSASESLQRIHIDDALHQMNNYIDDENILH